MAAGHDVQTRGAQRFAETVMPMITALQRSGVTSLRGIALVLNGRGVRTALAGDLAGVENVRNVLARVAPPIAQGVL